MNTRELLSQLGELKYIFEKHFDHPWFFALLEGIPIDPSLIKEIRDFLKLEESWAITESRSREGVRNLELFVLTLKHYLLHALRNGFAYRS